MYAVLYRQPVSPKPHEQSGDQILMKAAGVVYVLTQSPLFPPRFSMREI